MTNHLSRQNRVIATLGVLFFILYCSVGVCTNLIGGAGSGAAHQAAQDAESVMDHSQHAGFSEAQSQLQSHCESEPNSCEWSINPVSDPVSAADPVADYFVHYLTLTAALILVFLSFFSHKRSSWLASLREQYYRHSYPRLHLQHSVFLN